MKSLFMSLWKSILKHKKKLIYTILAFIIGQICFFNLWWIGLENNVYAADSGTTQANSSQEWVSGVWEKMGTIQKIIYIFIFPLLVVAGKLVDNSFVYWEIFGFDAILWKLWNIVRNLANFGLWFLLIYHIFSNLLSKKWDMKKLLISTLIAWIWIQASWFVMAALIDMSTILTYSVGWLPISALKNKIENSDWEEQLKYNPYVLKSVISVDADSLKVDKYLTNAGTYPDSSIFYISECETFSVPNVGNDGSIELLLAPSMIYYKDESKTQNESTDKNVRIRQTESNACHFYNQVYYFKELYTWNARWQCIDTDTCLESQRVYDSALKDAIAELKSKSTADVSNLIDQATLLEVWNAHETWWIVWRLWTVLYTPDNGLGDYGVDLYNERIWSWKTITLDKILDGSSYVWVFTALYTSLINSIWIIPSDAGLYATVLNTALSVWHMIAIWIPLIVVAIVFMIRIWILWVAIVISPFIVLLKAFDLDSKVFKGDYLQYFQVTELLKIIFSPVIICFAISISTVLVTILSWVNVDSIESVKSEILWWLIKLDVWWFTIPIWKLIVSLLWVAITRFLVWAAVESGSKLWSSGIVTKLKGLAETTLWSIPIVPVIWRDPQWNPTTTFVWTNTAFGTNNKGWMISRITQGIKDEYDAESQRVINDIIDPSWANKRKVESYKQAISAVNASTLTGDWRDQIVVWNGSNAIKFANLPDNGKQEIIEAINSISDENKRQAFWAVPVVQFNNWTKDVTYNFNQMTKKYE